MSLPLFLIPIVVGLLAQALKRFFNKDWRAIRAAGGYLPRYGGMPSAHTAFAFSLATVVLLIDGWASTTFAMVAALTIFVLDDALRMRIFLGEHGKALYRLVQRLPEEERRAYPQLHTHLGHKPAEVTAGALLGIILSVVLVTLLT